MTKSPVNPPSPSTDPHIGDRYVSAPFDVAPLCEGPIDLARTMDDLIERYLHPTSRSTRILPSFSCSMVSGHTASTLPPMRRDCFCAPRPRDAENLLRSKS